MLTSDDLLACVDLFRAVTGVEEVTLSYRIFGDTKKLRQLRERRGITLERFNAAMLWLAVNWPAGADLPHTLAVFRDATPAAEFTPTPNKDSA
jgi:hypothetical protein